MALASVVVPYSSVAERSQHFDPTKELRKFLTTNIKCVETASSALPRKRICREHCAGLWKDGDMSPDSSAVSSIGLPDERLSGAKTVSFEEDSGADGGKVL